MDVELVGPPLPTEYAGKAIVWTPWRNRPGCGQTAVVRPCKACGSLEPWWSASGTVKRVRRVYGHYCPGCGELWVYWKVPPPPGKWVGRLDLIVHSTRQERIEAAMERLGARLRKAVQAEFRRAAREDLRRYVMRDPILGVHGE